MLDKMISINHIDFNKLEKNIYDIGCEYARNLMKEILMAIDQEISLSRDRKKYRHKGKRNIFCQLLLDSN